MPELPEVEAVCRKLVRDVVASRIVRAHMSRHRDRRLLSGEEIGRIDVALHVLAVGEQTWDLTGLAVVGQQPFGGSRASGTNDKAGSWLNLERWVTPRTIKETFLPPTTVGYPYMAEE